MGKKRWKRGKIREKRRKKRGKEKKKEKNRRKKRFPYKSKWGIVLQMYAL